MAAPLVRGSPATASAARGLRRQRTWHAVVPASFPDRQVLLMHRPLTVRTKLPDRRILCVDELCPKPAYLDADKVLQHLETVHSCPVKEEPVFEALLDKTKTGEAKCEAVQQVIVDNFRDPLVAYLNGKLDIPFVGEDQEPRNGSECRVGLRSRLRDPPDGC